MTTLFNRSRRKEPRVFSAWIHYPALVIALVIFIVIEGIRIVFFGPRDEDDGSQP